MNTCEITQREKINKQLLDSQAIRKDFPILSQKVHGKPLVYLDNAATSQKPNSVIATLEHFYRAYNSNVHRGVYILSETATAAFENARTKIQHFIHAKEDKEVIFVRGTTEAINLVASSFGARFIKQGDEIILSTMEHHSNIVPWQLLCERTGAILKIIPIHENGELNFEAYQQLLSSKTKLVSIIHISNALGTINPIKAIIKEAHHYNIPVLVDGAQAVSHQKVNVQDLDCDFYAFSGHKLLGPTGIGVLYGKKKWLEEMPPYQGGGEMIQSVTFEKTTYHHLPHKFEAGTPHIAGAIGLAAAVDYISKVGLDAIEQYENELLNYANLLAEQIPALKIIGTATQKTSILSFTLGSIHPHDIGTILDQEGIAIRVGHHCAMPLMKYFKVPATARASFAFYNTKDEIDQLFNSLQKVKEVFS